MPGPVDADTPNAQATHMVGPEDLPLHCPVQGSSLWNSHPKVYLPIEKTGKIHCPYCGTLFVLSEGMNESMEEPAP